MADLAFHNENDPHQAPRGALDLFDATIETDTYKVTAAQIETMDTQARYSRGFIMSHVSNHDGHAGTRRRGMLEVTRARQVRSG